MTTGTSGLIDFGSVNRREVSKHGHVIRTGMPLHDFEHDGVADLVVDHDAGSSRSKLTTRPTRSDDLTGEDLTDNCTCSIHPLH